MEWCNFRLTHAALQCKLSINGSVESGIVYEPSNETGDGGEVANITG